MISRRSLFGTVLGAFVAPQVRAASPTQINDLVREAGMVAKSMLYHRARSDYAAQAATLFLKAGHRAADPYLLTASDFGEQSEWFRSQ